MITLYGLPTCHSCKTVITLLDNYEIKYEYIDISKDKIYDGDVPGLKLDDGRVLVGFPKIKSYIITRCD